MEWGHAWGVGRGIGGSGQEEAKGQSRMEETPSAPASSTSKGGLVPLHSLTHWQQQIPVLAQVAHGSWKIMDFQSFLAFFRKLHTFSRELDIDELPSLQAAFVDFADWLYPIVSTNDIGYAKCGNSPSTIPPSLS